MKEKYSKLNQIKLIEDADKAMYEAKKLGKNRFVYATNLQK